MIKIASKSLIYEAPQNEILSMEIFDSLCETSFASGDNPEGLSIDEEEFEW